MSQNTWNDAVSRSFLPSQLGNEPRPSSWDPNCLEEAFFPNGSRNWSFPRGVCSLAEGSTSPCDSPGCSHRKRRHSFVNRWVRTVSGPNCGAYCEIIYSSVKTFDAYASVGEGSRRSGKRYLPTRFKLNLGTKNIQFQLKTQGLPFSVKRVTPPGIDANSFEPHLVREPLREFVCTTIFEPH